MRRARAIAGVVLGVNALVFATAFAGGCAKGKSPPPTSAPDAAPAIDEGAIARAEDLRRSSDVPSGAITSSDVAIKRRAARAYARIADQASAEILLRSLEDEDEETVAWSAYGLGFACKGREDATVKALAARSVSIGDGDPSQGTLRRDQVDARSAIARAIGKCGGAQAEPTLAAWVKKRPAWAERAAYAIGDIATRKHAIDDATSAALVDATLVNKLDAAMVAFGRLDHLSDAMAPRVAMAARAALTRATPARIFSLKALGRCGSAAIADLVRVVEDKKFTPAERAEAARALGLAGDEGRAAAADALAHLTPDTKDALAIANLGGDDFGPMTALVAAVGAEVPSKAEPAMYALASLEAPGTPPASLARRLADLRCGAAAALARGAYDADVLKKCDLETSEASERARLSALVRRPLAGDRKAAWRAFTKSDHVRVREAALEAIGQHPELGDTARAAIVDALGAKRGGIVATAAEVLDAHPDRALVLADAEKRAALDPSAPPPTTSPTKQVDAPIAAALTAALARAWPEDLVETRGALLDAAVAVGLDGARAAADRACHDPNGTMRDRAVKALRALGVAAPACSAPGGDAGAPAPEVAHPIADDVRVVLQTDAGDLTLIFEPALAPVAASRFVALARAGFYKGIVVHRVVPGFVAQLGDPDGDGYGGAGTLLRCETSPVPFDALDVGVALAGRDTGSSQIFVTLARHPHLDGEYARVGRAEGDWWALAEGDVIRDVKVKD